MRINIHIDSPATTKQDVIIQKQVTSDLNKKYNHLEVITAISSRAVAVAKHGQVYRDGEYLRSDIISKHIRVFTGIHDETLQSTLLELQLLPIPSRNAHERQPPHRHRQRGDTAEIASSSILLSSFAFKKFAASVPRIHFSRDKGAPSHRYRFAPVSGLLK